MSAPPSSAATRFLDPGTSRIYLVTAITDTDAPTRSELDAGIDITGDVAEIEGFVLDSEFNDTTVFNARVATSQPGTMRTGGAPRIVMYADVDGYDVRRSLSRGDSRYIVLLHGGDVAGHLMDVWPVTVAAVSKPFSFDAAAFVIVRFAIPGQPATDVEVP